MKSPTDKGLYGIWGNSESNIFAVGAAGIIIRFDGSRWKQGSSLLKENLEDIWGARDKMFIVGGFGTILRLDQ
jgi:hypothetical protein